MLRYALNLLFKCCWYFIFTGYSPITRFFGRTFMWVIKYDILRLPLPRRSGE